MTAKGSHPPTDALLARPWQACRGVNLSFSWVRMRISIAAPIRSAIPVRLAHRWRNPFALEGSQPQPQLCANRLPAARLAFVSLFLSGAVRAGAVLRCKACSFDFPGVAHGAAQPIGAKKFTPNMPLANDISTQRRATHSQLKAHIPQPMPRSFAT